MTAHKHFKQLIRARMEKTGERYSAARRNIIGAQNKAERTHPHLPGSVAATTALRILLTHTGVQAPHTGEPFSEAMLFGIAGGIGIGVFSFYYDKADFASFFIGGRHCWHDDLLYLRGALEAFGIEPVVRETSGLKAARGQLEEAVESGRPCIAWVDMACLPHRGLPASLQGGGYHVITVYQVDPKKGAALIGDLTDEPVEMLLSDLDTARARIKKQKFRLLWIEPAARPKMELASLVLGGLRRCRDGLLHPLLPAAKSNGRLEALQAWASRLAGSNDPQRWERVFRPGANLWRGLSSIHRFIEIYGTGGGLCRPLFAEFLRESAPAARLPVLEELAGKYEALGRDWSDLADAALPDSVAPMRLAKELRAQYAEMRHAGAPPEEIRKLWDRMEQLEKDAAADFPLAAEATAKLLGELQQRVNALYEGEAAALERIKAITA